MSKDKPTNLTSLEGGGQPNLSRAALAEIMAELPYQREYMKVVAELTRAKYLALIEQGFTEEQALELSKEIG